MKHVVIKPGKVVETPWLRTEESAAYCGMARSTFLDKAKDLPYGGDESLKLYNCQVLDRWLAGELPARMDKPPVARRRRRRVAVSDEPVLIDPVTGEVHRPLGSADATTS